MINLVLFGPPGAGKGTQSEKLLEHYNLKHLSTGDLLRNEIKGETDLGLEAKSYIDEGKLVPDEVVIGMIDKQLGENVSANGFIFDGFPRTVEQAKALDDLCKKHNMEITGMVALEVPHNELVSRLQERGKTSGRSDDQDINLIEQRIQEYEEKTAAVAGYYEQQGKFKKVNGVGSIEEIFSNLCSVIDDMKS